MYLGFYGLQNHPYSITPDPAFLYLSAHHREALGHLLYGTGEHGGFVQLTGEVGTGKTTLVRALLEQDQPGLDLALCLNPHLTVREFVAEVADELGVVLDDADQTSLKMLVDKLNQRLLKGHADGRRTVLIVDEAQNLSAEVLEQLRLLTNLETHTHKLMRIILVGQPELEALLRRPDLRQLAQRITARYHLRALNRAETVAYIRHRLKVAGGSSEIFSEHACHAVYSASGGIPRLINTVCERALMGGYSTGTRRIDAPMVRRAAREALPRADRWPPQRRRPTLVPAAALLAAGALGFALHYGLEHLEFGAEAAQAAPVAEMPDALPDAHASATQPAKSPPKSKSGAGPAVVEATAPRTAGADVPAVPSSGAKAKATAASVSSSVHAKPATRVAATGAADSAGTVTTAADAGIRPLPFPENDATITQLLRLWGVFGAPVDTNCWALKIGDLRCVIIDGTFKDLVRFNRPALLDLVFDRGRRNVLLVALDETYAILVFGDGTRRITRERLKALWTGQARLIWRQPIDVRNVGPGSVGGAVVWVRRQLARMHGINLDNTAGKPSPIYDQSLAEQIRSFQRDHGLQVDGVVGPRTVIALNGIAPAPGTPVLIEPKGQ